MDREAWHAAVHGLQRVRLQRTELNWLIKQGLSKGVLVVKNPLAKADVRDVGSLPGSERSPEGGHGNHPIFLPGETHGQRSLVSYCPRGCAGWP